MQKWGKWSNVTWYLNSKHILIIYVHHCNCLNVANTNKSSRFLTTVKDIIYKCLTLFDFDEEDGGLK